MLAANISTNNVSGDNGCGASEPLVYWLGLQIYFTPEVGNRNRRACVHTATMPLTQISFACAVQPQGRTSLSANLILLFSLAFTQLPNLAKKENTVRLHILFCCSPCHMCLRLSCLKCSSRSTKHVHNTDVETEAAIASNLM